MDNGYDLLILYCPRCNVSMERTRTESNLVIKCPNCDSKWDVDDLRIATHKLINSAHATITRLVNNFISNRLETKEVEYDIYFRRKIEILRHSMNHLAFMKEELQVDPKELWADILSPETKTSDK